MKKKRKRRKSRRENGQVLFIIFCYCVFVFCDYFFFRLSPVSLLYRKSKSGLHATRHFVNFFLLLLFDSESHYSHLHLPTSLLFSISLCIALTIDIKMFCYLINIGIYLCWDWDYSTFIKSDGNEADENGICRIGHWLEQTEISKYKSSRRNSTEISVVFASKSSIVRLLSLFSSFFLSIFAILPGTISRSDSRLFVSKTYEYTLHTSHSTMKSIHSTFI